MHCTAANGVAQSCRAQYIKIPVPTHDSRGHDGEQWDFTGDDERLRTGDTEMFQNDIYVRPTVLCTKGADCFVPMFYVEAAVCPVVLYLLNAMADTCQWTYLFTQY